MNRLLTVPDAAEALSVSENTVWNMIRTGELPSVKVRRARRIESEAIDRYIADRRQEGKEAQ